MCCPIEVEATRFKGADQHAAAVAGAQQVWPIFHICSMNEIIIISRCARPKVHPGIE